ncbi:unnamed protein product [Gadus morhua 'NCC']
MNHLPCYDIRVVLAQNATLQVAELRPRRYVQDTETSPEFVRLPGVAVAAAAFAIKATTKLFAIARDVPMGTGPQRGCGGPVPEKLDSEFDFFGTAFIQLGLWKPHQGPPLSAPLPLLEVSEDPSGLMDDTGPHACERALDSIKAEPACGALLTGAADGAPDGAADGVRRWDSGVGCSAPPSPPPSPAVVTATLPPPNAVS